VEPTPCAECRSTCAIANCRTEVGQLWSRNWAATALAAAWRRASAASVCSVRSHSTDTQVVVAAAVLVYYTVLGGRPECGITWVYKSAIFTFCAALGGQRARVCVYVCGGAVGLSCSLSPRQIKLKSSWRNIESARTAPTQSATGRQDKSLTK
jgi:hypothetical protein